MRGGVNKYERGSCTLFAHGDTNDMTIIGLRSQNKITSHNKLIRSPQCNYNQLYIIILYTGT